MKPEIVNAICKDCGKEIPSPADFVLLKGKCWECFKK